MKRARFGTIARSLGSLKPVQVLARPMHWVGVRAVRSVTSAVPPLILARYSPASSRVVAFVESERARYHRRRPHLPPGLLRAFEERYGQDLQDGVTPSWEGDPIAVRAYPASVRARRLAMAIRLGRQDLGPELTRAARATLVGLEFHLLANHLLENAFGLACAGAVARGAEGRLWWSVGCALLDWQLREQFLRDGGHFERSATYHLALTAGLLETIELARAGSRDVPTLWTEVACRALGWAAAVRAPDGTYPLFNDASLDAAPDLDVVLELGELAGFRRPDRAGRDGRCWFEHLSDTGWVLMGTPDGAWLCLDAGADGAPYQPGHVHADSLTFELWVEGQRAVVDYGVSSYANDALRDETRATRSHNVVELGGVDSSEVWSAFRVGRRARAWIEELRGTAEQVTLCAAHDGYRWLEGAPEVVREVHLSRGRAIVRDTIRGAAVTGMSRLRVDEEANARINVASRGPTRTRAAHWYPRFAEARPAIVHEQLMIPHRGSTFELRW